eukprot:COSAG01_NODE_18602_length_1065_cov_0.894410_1_plen_74_part_10
MEVDALTVIHADDCLKPDKPLRFCVRKRDRELWLEAECASDKRAWLAILQATLQGFDQPTTQLGVERSNRAHCS